MFRESITFCTVVFLLVLIGYLTLAPATAKEPISDKKFALKVGNKILNIAPLTDPGDVQAFNRVSEKLVTLVTEDNVFTETVKWGDRKEENGYDPDNNHLTLFDGIVFLKLYLSTFMFEGVPQVIQKEDYTVLQMNIRFRHQLDPGYLPYPFWHSEKKWKAYHFATKLEFVFEENKIIAVYRSTEWDTQRYFVNKKFDGNWNWTSAKGSIEPSVTLFTRIFTKDNPYIADLDQTFRRLEAESRKQRCMTCHLPSNPSKMQTLILLNYPNQSLGAREKLIEVFEENRMPPATSDSRPGGIENEKIRGKLLKLAKKFASLADKAFAYDFKQK
jgi:hypothetical protein